MKREWIQSKKFKGVRWRLHPTRKHGVQFDRYYALRYQVDGERREEGLGWASDAENWTEEKAGLKLAQLKSEGLRLSDERRLTKEQRTIEEARGLAEAEARRTLSEYWQESYFPAAQRSKKAVFMGEGREPFQTPHRAAPGRLDPSFNRTQPMGRTRQDAIGGGFVNQIEGIHNRDLPPDSQTCL